MKLVFLMAARLEEREAAAWYRTESAELALRFRSEVRQTLERVASSPNHFPLITLRVRRTLVPIFPYAVLFEIREEAILVLAIAHTSREPRYWRNRPD